MSDQEVLTKPKELAEYLSQRPWGMSTCIDLYTCNPELIRSRLHIQQYVDQLVDLIEMQKFGPCHIVNFGEDERVAGFSMFQLIETSCISGHFANQSNHAYLDIFSCKQYSVKTAAEFSKDFFQAKQVRTQMHQRW